MNIRKCDRWDCLDNAHERRDEQGRVFGTYCDKHWQQCWETIQQIRRDWRESSNDGDRNG